MVFDAPQSWIDYKIQKNMNAASELCSAYLGKDLLAVGNNLKIKNKHPIGRYNIFKEILIFSPSKSWKNIPKSCFQLGVFFSASQTAQNSQELHFRFMNSYIQPTGFTGTFPRNQDAKVKLKSELVSIKF